MSFETGSVHGNCGQRHKKSPAGRSLWNYGSDQEETVPQKRGHCERRREGFASRSAAGGDAGLFDPVGEKAVRGNQGADRTVTTNIEETAPAPGPLRFGSENDRIGVVLIFASVAAVPAAPAAIVVAGSRLFSLMEQMVVNPSRKKTGDANRATSEKDESDQENNRDGAPVLHAVSIANDALLCQKTPRNASIPGRKKCRNVLHYRYPGGRCHKFYSKKNGAGSRKSAPI